MTLKELYEPPVTEVIKVMEACAILAGSNVNSELEDPFIDDNWDV